MQVALASKCSSITSGSRKSDDDFGIGIRNRFSGGMVYKTMIVIEVLTLVLVFVIGWLAGWYIRP